MRSERAREKPAADIKKLSKEIQKFNVRGVAVFVAYQKLGIGTSKWKLIDHIPDDTV